ncbi:MAG: dephospho-CoA kinase [Fibrobacteria bacterium]|nr:dephospho-CoA kinase [Fibrobacteria bacterium]
MRLPRRVGLVGGIASGKSMAASWFEARGWTLVDADREAHALYAPGTLLRDRLVGEFGPRIASDDGSIDRAALGSIVFGDPARLARLESLVHPALRERVAERISIAESRDERMVLEMALMSRWPEMAARLDVVLGVSAPMEVRLERLCRRNSLDPAEARRRIERQPPQADLLACAAVTLSNEGTREDFLQKLEVTAGWW